MEEWWRSVEHFRLRHGGINKRKEEKEKLTKKIRGQKKNKKEKRRKEG